MGTNGNRYYSLYVNTRDTADSFLKGNKIYYEKSGCGNGFYFCVLLSPDRVDFVNNFLNTLL